jgi:hypothetical protein
MTKEIFACNRENGCKSAAAAAGKAARDDEEDRVPVAGENRPGGERRSDMPWQPCVRQINVLESFTPS